MHLTVDDFYSDLVKICIDNKITLRLLHKKTHMGCGGWVTEDELMVCTKHPLFLDIMVHEYSHLTQLFDKDSMWHHKDIASHIDIWKRGFAKKHPILNKRAFKKTCELEIDCDERAIRLIKKYNLPVDMGGFIRAANCYHASYYYFHKYSCFYHTKNIPYTRPDVIEEFSSIELFTIEEAWSERKILGDFLKKYNKPI